MKKLITYLISTLLAALPILSVSAWAADQEKDQDRLQNSGMVLKEILDVPDDIPKTYSTRPIVWLSFRPY